MAGHNKWSKIKRKKGVEDARRSKIFSKLIKEITVALREGGSDDPEFNPRLRTAVANAKGVNMPRDNIERAIKKAAEGGGDDFLELTYEGYAPGGVAVFVECATDNQNRTVSNVRSYFSKFGGNMATKGSVDFLFERKGVFVIPEDGRDADDLMLEMIDAGAGDVDLDDGEFTITTAFDDFGKMQSYLEEEGIEVKSAGLERIPRTTTDVDDDTARTVMKLIEALDDDDDVQAVYHNMEISEELMAELA